MRFLKNINFLFLGLTLVFSLVSFSGVANKQPTAITKTTFVVSNHCEDTSFYFQFKSDNKEGFFNYLTPLSFSFSEFQNTYNLKESTTFKTYSNKILWFKAEKLQTQLYPLVIRKTLYNDNI